MGKNKKVEQNKVIVVKYKVSMYCNACERSVAKALSKCEGVEKFITDMKKHRVEVTGRIDPLKVLKKLKKKTGKRVEIVYKKDKDEVDQCDKLFITHQFPLQNDCCIKTHAIMMFSDDNPHACVVM